MPPGTDRVLTHAGLNVTFQFVGMVGTLEETVVDGCSSFSAGRHRFVFHFSSPE